MSTMSGGPNIVTNGLVLHLDAANTKSFRGIPTTNLLSNPTQILTTNEFGQYYNLASIFDTNGLVPYSLSFDMKVNKNGNVLVYMQNGSYTKYSFVNQTVSATTEYQRFKFENLTPSGPLADWQANTPTDNRAMLATYTVYGSGVIPTLTNFQLELGAVATPFVVGTRGTTVATGGGWADRTTNANHGELVGGPTYNSSNGGSIVFDGNNDYVGLSYINSPFRQTTQITYDFWVYKSVSGQTYIMGTSVAGGGGTGAVYFETNTKINFYWCPSNPVSDRIISADITNSLNNWNNFSFTINYQTGEYQWYQNGIAKTTSINNSVTTYTPSTTYNQNINDYIGGWYVNSAGYFTGRISLVKIYNRALSASEVLQNYNAQKSRFGLS